jgi:thioredoxin-like negative regulator of GroEL
MFAPIIEKAAAEAKGRWELVKVNTEEEQELATRFRIQSLPTIRIYRDGEVVSERLGSMPEPAFLEWVEEFAPSPGEEIASRIRDHLLSGNLAPAIESLEENEAILEPDPVLLFRAFIALATRPDAVAGLVGKIQLSASEHNDGAYLGELAGLRLEGGEGAFGEGLEALATLDLKTAAAKWIDALTLNDANSGARKALKNLFLLLGPQHPVTREYQPQFARLVYS